MQTTTISSTLDGQHISLSRDNGHQIIIGRKQHGGQPVALNVLEAAELLELLPDMLLAGDNASLATMEGASTTFWPDNNVTRIRQAIRNYLAFLKWDGQDHIARLASFFEDDHKDAYNQVSPIDHVEYRSEVFEVYLRYWLLGAVAKIWDQHANYMLVLHGPQGCGKSHFARWIGNVVPIYFAQAPVSPSPRDRGDLLTSRFVWEIDDIYTGKGKKLRDLQQQVALLEELNTTIVVQTRPLYRRDILAYPATASMIMTRNAPGFPVSQSMLICRINKIDRGYTQLNPHQVWAQAVSEYAELRQIASGQPEILSLLPNLINQEYLCAH